MLLIYLGRCTKERKRLIIDGQKVESSSAVASFTPISGVAPHLRKLSTWLSPPLR